MRACYGSHRKLRALYGKWVDALYSYDVEVWENHVSKSSSCRGSESPCRLAASLVAKAKVHDENRQNLHSFFHAGAYNTELISDKNSN